jgi:CheY-like chemotaxis protein
MSKAKLIILVDDDLEDEELLREVLHELGIKNKLIHFETCISAFDYLKQTTDNPFIIISDIKLPLRNGLDFKKQIDEDPCFSQKAFPLYFFLQRKIKDQ